MENRTFENKARIAILNKIMGCFQQVVQWDKFGYDTKESVVEYQHKAVVLIELLEVDDCMSVGGFDDSNKLGRETKNRSFNRFLCVLRKYNKPSDLRDNYVELFTQYFKD